VGSSAAPLAEVTIQTLHTIAQRYGTPTYAYDIGWMRNRVAELRIEIPRSVDLLYSLKANPSLGLCDLMASWGLGADVASAGELLTALRGGFPPERIFVSGPYKSQETLALLRSTPGVILSIDSLSELHTLAAGDYPNRALLRLRPDFTSSAAVDISMGSRFGIPFEDLPHCRPYLASRGITVVGFHVFSGSQVLDVTAIVRNLRGAMELSLRAANLLGVVPEILNLGGGFGIPYGPDDQELDLDPIANELQSLLDRLSPARVVLELGRYLVAQAGWYLTTVVAHQTHRGRPAVVVDGGIHQRSDLCGLNLRTRALPPIVLNGRESPLGPTDILGCLCLPDDVLAESSPLPPLCIGDILAFSNAGAYGLSASPTAFLGHPAPAEVAFEGTMMELLRIRPPAQVLLEGQVRLLYA
jgi:diaminopimelate decarboxylase